MAKPDKSRHSNLSYIVETHYKTKQKGKPHLLCGSTSLWVGQCLKSSSPSLWRFCLQSRPQRSCTSASFARPWLLQGAADDEKGMLVLQHFHCAVTLSETCCQCWPYSSLCCWMDASVNFLQPRTCSLIRQNYVVWSDKSMLSNQQWNLRSWVSLQDTQCPEAINSICTWRLGLLQYPPHGEDNKLARCHAGEKTYIHTTHLYVPYVSLSETLVSLASDVCNLDKAFDSNSWHSRWAVATSIHVRHHAPSLRSQCVFRAFIILLKTSRSSQGTFMKREIGTTQWWGAVDCDGFEIRK